VVGRLDLWSAAIRLIQTRPVLGFGPDNFRHLYGAELGLETWDQRVQANNLYLELLVDFGVFGLAAFVWLVVPPLVRVIQTLRERGTRNAELGTLLGLGLGILAFLVHGLLDSFRAFTPTALLFWMLLGLTQPSAVSNQEHVPAESSKAARLRPLIRQ
jgi:O-antigen ligase